MAAIATPASSETPTPERPAWRGVIHRYAAAAFAGAFAVLAATAGDAAAAAWIAIYGVCVTAMLTVSAVYHSGRLSEPARATFKRLDHSMILVAIAGSCTGVVGLALRGGDRVLVLSAVWLVAAVAVGIRMWWLHAPYPVTATVYVAVGWVVLIDVGAFVDALSGVQLALVVAGGVVYSLGAVVYALHRPNPWPATFGYHEVFHTLTVGAAAMHLAAVASIVSGR
jgi:hemolysin III